MNNHSESSRTSQPVASSELPPQGGFRTVRRSRWRSKRVLLASFFIAVWLIVAYKLLLSPTKPKKPRIIHADRYSDKYKYRPAASPVVTETMRDGTIVLRGAFRNPHAEHDEL